MELDIPELEELLLEYQDKAAEIGDWIYYLKAHGVANYLVATDSTERMRLVYDIEKSWYKGRHPLSYDEHQVLTNKHKQLLIDYRDETKLNFDNLKVDEEALEVDDIFSDTNLNNAHVFSHHVFLMSKRCSDDFITVSRSIMESSVHLLVVAGLSPPCPFAVIGLGSVARGEATPYSDLEYAFLVEDDSGTEYFKQLAVDSYFRIGNLGESPLKTFDIKCQNDLSVVGFRIDGLTAKAGNIPTGNGVSQSLILTVDKLMEIYKKEVMSQVDEKAPLSDLLSTSMLIYAYNGGEKLHQQFVQDRLTYENEVANFNLFAKRKRLITLSNDIKQYSFLQYGEGVPNNTNVKVKVDIFRFPTLLATNLNICMTLDSQYPWDAYTKIKQLSILTQENLRYMNIVLGLSIYIRTSAYLAMRTQYEHISLYGPAKSTKSVSFTDRYYLSRNLFVTLGCLIIPIKHSIFSSLQRIYSQLSDLQTVGLATFLKHTVKEFAISKTDFMLKAEVLRFSGDDQAALQHLYSTIGKDTVNNNCVRVIEVIRDHYKTNKSDPREKKYLNLICNLLNEANRPSSTLHYISWYITYESSNLGVALLKRVAADCLNRLEKHSSARASVNQAILLVKKELGLGILQSLPHYVVVKLSGNGILSDEMVTCSEVTGGLYNTLGNAYRYLHEADRSVECFHTSLSIYLLLEKTKLIEVQKEVAMAAGNLSIMYKDMSEYENAISYSDMSIKSMKSLYGEHANHVDIALMYNNIGNVYREINMYEKCLEYEMKSLNMTMALNGQHSNSIGIALCHTNIGITFTMMKDHEKALEYYTLSLNMWKATEGQTHQIAYLYMLIGRVHDQRGEEAYALEHYTKSLQMMKSLYGEQANHSRIASLYNNMAYCYNRASIYTNALDYYTKALHMYNVLHGAHSNHHLIVETYWMIANLYRDAHQYRDSFYYYNQVLMTQYNYTKLPSLLNDISQVWTGLSEHRRAQQFSQISLSKTVNTNLLQCTYHQLGVCCLKMGSWRKSWYWLYSSLCLYESFPPYNNDKLSFAEVYLSIGLLLLHLNHVAQSLEHSQLALDITTSLLVENGSRNPDYIRVHREAKSLTDSLHLVKLCQHHFPVAD